MFKYVLEEKKKSAFIPNKLHFPDSKSEDETLKKCTPIQERMK